MVKAIIAGNKTQTRRKATVHDWPTDVTYAEEGWGKGKSPKPKWLFTDDGAFNGFSLNCPYGEPGNRLWVRETFQPVQLASEVTQWRYRATDEKGLANWKPSIFMPRKASRITLEIVSLRVERLNDITEDDAFSEGCSADFLHSDTCSNDNCALCGGVDDCEGVAVSAKENYRALWERINGKGSWDANPWVWVVAFKKVFNVRMSYRRPKRYD